MWYTTFNNQQYWLHIILKLFQTNTTLCAFLCIQVVKRTLAALPYNSQSQSPSAYFDQYLFHYDEKVQMSSLLSTYIIYHSILYSCGSFCGFLQCDNVMLFVVQLISSTDRHKPCMEHPIKFISRRRPNTLKFKINPGTWDLQNETLVQLQGFSVVSFCQVMLKKCCMVVEKEFLSALTRFTYFGKSVRPSCILFKVDVEIGYFSLCIYLQYMKHTIQCKMIQIVPFASQYLELI